MSYAPKLLFAMPLLLTMILFVLQNIYFQKYYAPIKEKLIFGLSLIPCSFEFVTFIILFFVGPYFDDHIFDFPMIKSLRALPRTNARVYVCIIYFILMSIALYGYHKLSNLRFSISLGQYMLFTMIDCIGLMFDKNIIARYTVEIIMYLFGFLYLRKDVVYAITHSKYFASSKNILAVAVPMPLCLALVCFKSPESRYSGGYNSIQSSLNVYFCIILFISSLMISKLLLKILQRTIHIQQDMEIQDFLTAELMKSQEGVILTFSEIVSNKSGETGNHVKRVAGYTAILARKLGYPDEAVEEIRLASMMHDIGKLMVSNEIIEKPGALTQEEFNEMKKHVTYGEKLLAHTGGGIMKKARIIAKEHHERWDGKGYMNGLKGNQTSELAQIVAIADVFDALTSRRSYKEPWPCSMAREEIIKNKGTQFSPKCVDAFEKCYHQFLEIRKEFPDEIGKNAANDGLLPFSRQKTV